MIETCRRVDFRLLKTIYVHLLMCYLNIFKETKNIILEYFNTRESQMETLKVR